MMTSSNRNIFRVTDPLCEEFTGRRWIPQTNASDAELWCIFLICAWINDWVNKQSWGWWFERPSYPLWRHCNMLRDYGCFRVENIADSSPYNLTTRIALTTANSIEADGLPTCRPSQGKSLLRDCNWLIRASWSDTMTTVLCWCTGANFEPGHRQLSQSQSTHIRGIPK